MYKNEHKIHLDAERLRLAMEERGISSTKELAAVLGVHRNTISNYLTGKTTVPVVLGKMLDYLDIDPAEVFFRTTHRRQVPALAIMDLVNMIYQTCPKAVVVLFGSRARGTATRYSDYDLGIFRIDALDFSTYSRLLDLVGEWNSKSLEVVQLVHLGQADSAFLQRVAEDLVFLAGSPMAWCALLEKAGLRVYE